MGDEKILTERTNLWAILIALVILAVGVFLLISAEYSKFVSESVPLKSLVSNSGSVLITSVALIFLWELRARRSFFAEIMHHVKLGENVKTAGVSGVGVSSSIGRDFDWPALFGQAREVDILVAYANTWRSANRVELQKFAENSSKKMRVILPDPEHQELMAELARRFNLSPDEVKKEIIKASTEFISIFTQAGGKERLEVWFHSASPVFSCYRFDKLFIFTTYKYSPGRGIIPYLLADGGTLSGFFESELTALTSPGSTLTRRSYPKISQASKVR